MGLTHSTTVTDKATIDVPPGGQVCLEMKGTVTTMSADWSTDVDLRGDILCRFDSRCQGHYLWYVSLDGFTNTVSGTTTSDTSSSGGTQPRDGACPNTVQNSSLNLPVV